MYHVSEVGDPYLLISWSADVGLSWSADLTLFGPAARQLDTLLLASPRHHRHRTLFPPPSHFRGVARGTYSRRVMHVEPFTAFPRRWKIL